jgi:hypothetical protein
MAKNSKNRKRAKVPAASLAMFGVPSLLEGEDVEAYHAMMARVRAAVKPNDVLEEMWVQDCADQFWETLRLRRQKTELIKANMYRGLKIVLEPLCGYKEAEDLTSGWSLRDEEALERIEELLESAHLSMAAVEAQAMAEVIEQAERIDRMIVTSEVRRNATLRELERHRGALARMVRQETLKIEDAEFVELAAQQPDEAPGVDTLQIEAEPVGEESEYHEAQTDSEAEE